MTQDGEDEQSVEIFLKQAEIARQRLAWEDAVKVYQVALRQVPSDRRLRLGLAQAYEARAQQAQLKPLYLMALQEYWRLLAQDPADAGIHDALMAVALKADQMEETLEEYRARLKQNPDNETYKTAFKKLQAMLLLRTQPTVLGTPGPKGTMHTLMNRVSPFLALACFLIYMVLVRKIATAGGAASPALVGMSKTMVRSSIFLIVTYLGYQAYLRLRYSR